MTAAADALDAAGLYEALRPVYGLITPVFEARHDYAALAGIYRHLGNACEAIARAEAAGQRRLFAAYFRFTFFGKVSGRSIRLSLLNISVEILGLDKGLWGYVLNDLKVKWLKSTFMYSY